MAWHGKGEKALSEPMLTRFTDAYMRYYGEMGKLLPVYVYDKHDNQQLTGLQGQ